jgi:putative PIN family toxin of toxin-antitoxin system
VSSGRGVLDTNIVVSALLFRGTVSRLHALWKKKAFVIAASREIIDEYIRVLAYPRFELTEGEIEAIVREELLPYIEPVSPAGKSARASADPADNKFLACAEAADADCIVSGDAHLLDVKKHKGCPILTAEQFLKKFR